MTDALKTLEERKAQIEKDIAEYPRWGAYLAAKAEELRGIDREAAYLLVSLPLDPEELVDALRKAEVVAVCATMIDSYSREEIAHMSREAGADFRAVLAKWSGS